MEIIKEDDKIRLLDMADSIREIQGYIGNTDLNELRGKEDILEVVSAQLQQIGSAASLLTDEFKDKYGDIDWDVLKGLQYANFDQEMELDNNSIWFIIQNDLPIINEQILDIASLLEQQEDLQDVSLDTQDLRDLKQSSRNLEDLSYLNPDKDVDVEDATDIQLLSDENPLRASEGILGFHVEGSDAELTNTELENAIDTTLMDSDFIHSNLKGESDSFGIDDSNSGDQELVPTYNSHKSNELRFPEELPEK